MSKKQDRAEAKKRMQKYVGAAIGTGTIHNAGSYINKQILNKKK